MSLSVIQDWMVNTASILETTPRNCPTHQTGLSVTPEQVSEVLFDRVVVASRQSREDLAIGWGSLVPCTGESHGDQAPGDLPVFGP